MFKSVVIATLRIVLISLLIHCQCFISCHKLIEIPLEIHVGFEKYLSVSYLCVAKRPLYIS